MHCDTYYDSRQSRNVEIPDAVKRGKAALSHGRQID